MNLPNVIGICGQAAAGKDTLAKWFIGRGYGRSGFADPIKWMLNQAFGFSPDDWEDRRWKEDAQSVLAYSANGDLMAIPPRYLAQWLGTEVVRNNFGPDAWVNLWKQRWHDTGQPRVVVADVRFDNEVDAIHKLGGIVIRVTRKSDRSAHVYMHDGEIEHRPHESEMTDGLLAYSIDKMKEYGIVDSGDALTLGIGAMTDARMRSFYDKMVRAGVVKPSVDPAKSYTLRFVNKKVGLDLRPKQ